LAPVLSQLSSSHKEIKKAFDLVQSVFNAFDEKKTGLVDRSEFSVLIKSGFLDEDSLMNQFREFRDKLSLPQFFAIWSVAHAKGK